MSISTFPLQAVVTEPVKSFLDPVIVSGTLHVYVSQTDRGELVFGAMFFGLGERRRILSAPVNQAIGSDGGPGTCCPSRSVRVLRRLARTTDPIHPQMPRHSTKRLWLASLPCNLVGFRV